MYFRPLNSELNEKVGKSMKSHHLDETLPALNGPTQAQITHNNQWAAVALDRFHANSNTILHFEVDGLAGQIDLKWDSSFSKAAMKEEVYMAFHGGEGLAMFIMSVICGYSHAGQSEIGTGVDYWFMKEEPSDEDLNFLDNYHYVEISGILKESKTNTLKGRIKDKHRQIVEGGKQNESSVIVTLFSEPKTVKEIHR
jgi:hypothetical protein